MENESASAWDLPRSDVRLWLTIALGILGIWLFPIKEACLSFPKVQGVAALVWMTAALAGVLLLHREEKSKVAERKYMLMGLAWVLCLYFFFGLSFVWFYFIIIILVVVGASLSALKSHDEPRPLSWIKTLTRGIAIALTAPLVLFASRPTTRSRPSFPLHMLSRAVFALLPYALATGFALPFMLAAFGHYEIAFRLGLIFISFSILAWLGCALLFLLSPWPQNPRRSKWEDFPLTRGTVFAGTLVLIAMVALVLVREFDKPTFRVLIQLLNSPLFVAPCIGCALFFVLSPWPGYPRLPKLGELPETRKVGPLGTAIFLMIALVPLGSFALSEDSPFIYVMSGQLFASQFSRTHVGSALDQPTIGKWLFIFTWFTAMVFPYVAVARWISNRRTRSGYWTFTIPTVALCLCPLTFLTCAFWWLLQYVGAMGFTPARMQGLIYGFGGYIILLGFLYWAVRPPNKTTEKSRKEKSDSFI